MKNVKRISKLRQICVHCRREYPHAYESFCPCGGMIDIEYDLENARLHDSDNVFERYFDLLPICNPDHLLPVKLAASPTVRAEGLGAQLGLDELYVKNETVFPTCSTKDRMAIAVHSFFREVGVKSFTASSTGNSSTALAHYVRFAPDHRIALFVAEDFLPRLQFEENGQVDVYCLRGATFVEACDEARAFADRNGITAERGYFNPARREGLKTSFLEAAEAIPGPIDWYVQAVSSAMGVYGVFKGAKEFLEMGRIQRLPRLLCVQQETCSPMVKAYEAGSPVIRPQDIFQNPTGIASSILRGNPTRSYPYTLGIVNESNGTILAVSETEIREARKMVSELEGIDCCFTASVAVAGLKRAAACGQVNPKDVILLNLTGADRPAMPPLRNVCYLQRTPEGWKSETGERSELF